MTSAKFVETGIEHKEICIKKKVNIDNNIASGIIKTLLELWFGHLSIFIYFFAHSLLLWIQMIPKRKSVKSRKFPTRMHDLSAQV